MNKYLIAAIIIIGLGTAYYFLYQYNYNEAKDTMSLVMPDYTLVYAQDTDTVKTTWDECLELYDLITCAQVEESLYKGSGKTFYHTEPSEVIRDYDIDLYNKCIEDYKEEYDYIINQSDPSTDPCHQALS